MVHQSWPLMKIRSRYEELTHIIAMRIRIRHVCSERICYPHALYLFRCEYSCIRYFQAILSLGIGGASCMCTFFLRTSFLFLFLSCVFTSHRKLTLRHFARNPFSSPRLSHSHFIDVPYISFTPTPLSSIIKYIRVCTSS